MKKLSWIIKAIIAGILAFSVLNVFSFFYYNVPQRCLPEDGSTDYKWPSYAFHSQATEGFGFGRVNDDGYNNLKDLSEYESIEILFMGSSHLEGFNVRKDRNAAAILSGLSEKNVYNIGISEHTLLRCLDNLENAIRKYKPREYIVIETMTVSFYDDELKNALNGEGRLPVYSGRVIDILQNLKYLKLVYYQYNNVRKAPLSVEVKSPNNSELLDRLLSKTEEICKKENLQLIIVFHPTLSIENDGSIIANYNPEDADLFEELCEQHGIVFCNMEESFVEYYNKENKLPHGFNNTTPGSGHLNEIGHYLIAYKVNELIEEELEK